MTESRADTIAELELGGVLDEPSRSIKDERVATGKYRCGRERLQSAVKTFKM